MDEHIPVTPEYDPPAVAVVGDVTDLTSGKSGASADMQGAISTTAP